MNYSFLLDSIFDEMDASNPRKNLNRICKLLKENANSFDWVGFYIMNHKKRTLHLASYVGEKTDHLVIPFGKGICGQVADSGETYIAKDINTESNYIACSLKVKSEIVCPIYHGEKLVAQLDIDSHTPNAFGKNEIEFLEKLCLQIGQKMGAELHFDKFGL